MARTVLQIVQNALRLIGFDAPNSIISPSGNYDIDHYRVLLDSVGREMAGKYSWPSLIRSYSITLISGVSVYSLPGDCAAAIPQTVFDNSSTDWLIGPLSDEEAALSEFDPLSQGVAYSYIPQGFNRIKIFPTPTETLTVKLRYKTVSWLLPLAWQEGLSISVGSYISNGDYIYTASNAGTSGSSAPVHTSGSASDGGITWLFYGDGYDSILNDSDFPIIDANALEYSLVSAMKARLEQPNDADVIRSIRESERGFGDVKIGKKFSFFRNERRIRTPWVEE